jgi:hypothetical protein
MERNSKTADKQMECETRDVRFHIPFQFWGICLRQQAMHSPTEDSHASTCPKIKNSRQANGM